MKACSKCAEVKPDDSFYKRGRDSGKLFAACKSCVLADRRARYESDGDVLRERVRAYQAANPEKVRETVARSVARSKAADPEKWTKRNRASQLKKYGLTPEQADALFAAQGELCAICQSDDPGRSWTVDHDHTTGAVRGILCWHCNVALGHFRDDIPSLLAAADYLLRSRASVAESA